MDDRLLARLIAGRDAPSVLEKEQLFEHIYARVEGQNGRRSSLTWAWGALGGVAMAAALALFLVRPSADEFQARGGAMPQLGPELVVSCAGAGECRAGAKLTLAVRAPGYGYFAAFARRFDGTIIWYFPEPTSTSLPVPEARERFLLDRAVLLGAEHLPGHYDVYGIFTRRPLSREELKAKVGDNFAGSADAVVVRRGIEVRP